MGPLTLSAIIAGAVALSSDVMVSMGTYIIMNKKKEKNLCPTKDPLKEMIKRRGSYADFRSTN